MKVLVTGGAGFIGSALVRHLIHDLDWQVVNVDKLTYAANPSALASVESHAGYYFEYLDICDASRLRKVFAAHQPDAVIHLAAESHVDRSIDAPSIFMQTNIIGTQVLLQESLRHWESRNAESSLFRFLHVSTDEVYGALGEEGEFLEGDPYRPNSPYSASKASSDLLVRAWNRTFGLPTLQTNSSNNYGPWQHDEKLIPRMINLALAGKPLPIFGSGLQVRDWIHVDDHVRALVYVLEHGKVGEAYNVGARCEKTNLEVVEEICDILDDLSSELPSEDQNIHSYRDLITHVADRAGHDFRYALNAKKLQNLGWAPQICFAQGLRDLLVLG